MTFSLVFDRIALLLKVMKRFRPLFRTAFNKWRPIHVSTHARASHYVACLCVETISQGAHTQLNKQIFFCCVCGSGCRSAAHLPSDTFHFNAIHFSIVKMNAQRRTKENEKRKKKKEIEKSIAINTRRQKMSSKNSSSKRKLMEKSSTFSKPCVSPILFLMLCSPSSLRTGARSIHSEHHFHAQWIDVGTFEIEIDCFDSNWHRSQFIHHYCCAM